MGVKLISQQWALGPMRSPAIAGSEDMAGRLSAQSYWAGLVKGRPRRSVSLDEQNGSPTHALYTVRNCPKWKENARRSGGNHNCRIKCKEATFLAALMWRGQENSIILANATHRKRKGMFCGTGTQVEA